MSEDIDINDRSATPTSWYEVREVVEVGGVEKLFVPRENPREYEYSIDFCFATEEDAQDWINDTWVEEKKDLYEASNWVIVKITREEIRPALERFTDDPETVPGPEAQL